MSPVLQLDPAIEDLGVAIGLLKSGAGGTSLDASFFSAPWNHVSQILSNATQRAALIDALEALLPAQDPALLDPADSGVVRNAYPLLDAGQPGQIYVVAERAGPASSADLSLAVLAEVAAANGGPSALAELTLITAHAGALAPAFATQDHPLRIEARAPLGAAGAEVIVSLRAVAPPNENQTRFVVELAGLPGGAAPLQFDLTSGVPPISRIVAALLELGLAEFGANGPPVVQRVAESLPPLLGLSAGMDPLPLESLTHDVGALRGWFASLATSQVNNRPALVEWLDALGKLLGAPALASPLPAATEDDPVVLRILESTSGGPNVAVTAGIRIDAATGAAVLVLGLRVELASSTVNAAVRAEVVLLALPLTGTAPAKVLERIDLRVDAPASTAPLITGGAGALTIQSLRAGFRYSQNGSGPSIVPLLELLGVDVTIAGKATHFDQLDFTDTGTLTSAAETLLDNALSAGLGQLGNAANALRTLAGLVITTPRLDLAKFASDPTGALADYYRALRTSPDGWKPVVLAVGQLLGSTATQMDGAGTADEPWRLDLDAFVAPAGSSLRLRAAVWDAGDVATPSLRLALRAETSGTNWKVSVGAQLLELDLPAGGGGSVRWLGEIRGDAEWTPPALPTVGGFVVGASKVTGSARWRAGSPLVVGATIADIALIADDTTITLGTLELPTAGLDATAPDLGLGLDPTALWDVARLLMSRCSSSWGGGTARALLAILGVAAPGTPGMPRGLPGLSLPTEGDLVSLLQAPLEAVRVWLAGILADGFNSLTDDGEPFAYGLLRTAHAVLTNHLITPNAGLPVPDVAIHGAGVPADPWALPLQSEGAPPVEVLVWLEPEGPPASWSAAATDILSESARNASDVVDAALAITDAVPGAADAMTGRDPEASARYLKTLAAAIADSDGLITTDGSTPVNGAWTVGPPVNAAHHRVPSDPDAVSQLNAAIGTWTTGVAPGNWAVLLLAPPWAGGDCWDALLAGVGDAERASINFRLAGIPPAQVDLGGTAAAQWYVVDLADDGTAPLADVTARLDRAVTAVRAAKPGARVILVAHSYLALVAQAYAAGSPAQVLGLAALAAPLGSGELVSLSQSEIAEGVRLARALTPYGADGAVGDVLDLLAYLLEGYQAGDVGQPPVPAPFSVAAFTRGSGAALDLHGLPALAIAGSVQDDLRERLSDALQFQVQVGNGRATPTHLAWGVRTGLALPSAVAGDPDVDLDIALDWGRLALILGAPPPDVQPAIEIRARVVAANGWLLGGAGDGSAIGARVRWAEFVATVAPHGTATDVALDIRLHDAALRGSAAAVVTLNDPRGAELLNALIRQLDTTAKPNGRLDALLGFLAQLGLIRRATSSVTAAVLSDGFAAIATDGAGTLGPILSTMLDQTGGLFGIKRAAGAATGGGPWRLAFDPLPIELVVEKAPWRITVHTTGSGLPIGPDSTLTATGIVTLADVVPTMAASVSVGPTSVGQSAAGAPVILSSPFLDAPLTLVPGNPSTIAAALIPVLPRVIVGSVLTAFLEQYLGSAFIVSSIDLLLRDPGAWLARAGGLGDGSLPLAAPVNKLLAAVAKLAGLSTSATQPLVLPGGFVLSASDAGTGASRHFRANLATQTPIDLWAEAGSHATLALALGVDLDAQHHVAPSGQVSLHLPLPGTWGAVDVTFGADPAGLLATIATTSGVNLTLLPSVSGVDTLLAAAGQQLLAEVLDQLAVALDGLNPRPTALDDVLAIAKAFGIYDDTAAAGQRFKAKTAALKQLVTDLAAGNFSTAANGIASAIATLLTRLFGASIIAPALGPGKVGLQIGGVLGGSVALTADLSTTPPGLHATLQNVAAGAATIGADVGFVSGALSFGVDVGVSIDTGVGLVLTPAVSAGLVVSGGPRLSIQLKPLGTNEVVIALAPTPAPPTIADVTKLADAWLVPLAGTLMLRAADAAGIIHHSLWSGSTKTVGDLLVAMKVASGPPSSLALVNPLPSPPTLLKGLLDGLTGVPVPLPGGFSVNVVTDGSRYGLAVAGEQDFPVGDYAIDLMLGVPATLDPGWGPTGNGVGFLLLDLTTPSTPKLAPVLRLGGLGVRVGKKDATSPLISEGGFQLGAAAAYVHADVALSGTGAPKLSGPVYGAVELDALGLTIATGDNSSNPVAASLLQRSSSGDPAPANPPFDLLVATGPSGWDVEFSGEAKLRIEVKRSFGPLYLDEIDLLYQAVAQGPGKIGLGITGGVSIAALVLQVDDLELLVPLNNPSNISAWSLDLGGLALSLETSAVSVVGGLLKANLPGGVIDYEGMLGVQVAGRSITAIGAYSRPTDPGLGSYTSLFVFVAISTPIGGPPYFFVTGLAGGLGFNRRLLTPRDPAAVPSFPLVAAMAGGGPPDPMARLKAISQDIPPSRGSFWLAAGLQFSTFEILNTTALVCVALDHGLEITLLGLMRLALPDPEAAVVSLELALSAKYSTVDQVLSVRAGLTDNSWLISPDCRLTGGFAFVAWFRGRPESSDHSPEVMLSIGGYSRFFQKPPSYPDVPRVGFHWEVGGGIVIKGESFFALTHSAIMLGGALEASYDVSPIKIWFAADLDVIIWWDPFHYHVAASVSIGASFHFEVCFFACATISVSVTLGATLDIVGPPLHGVVTVDLDIASVTVEFGTHQEQAYLTWPQASLKYLSGGNAGAAPTAASVMFGAAPVNTGGDPNGTESAPWPVSPEFGVRVETKMPTTTWHVDGVTPQVQTSVFAKPWYDLVPADTNFGNLHSRLLITIQQKQGATWAALGTIPLDASEAPASFPGAVWDASSLGDGSAPTPMVPALGAVELRASVTSTEVTGALSDIPFSTMVEEETSRPLVFGSAATGATGLGGLTTRRLTAKATSTPKTKASTSARSATPATPVAPRLKAAVHAPRATTRVAASLSATLQKTVKAAATIGEPLAPGGAHLWELDPATAHDISIQGADLPIRVTALNGAGGLVADTQAPRGKSVAPAGASTVIVGEAPSASVAGWELGTHLLRVSAGTLLAPGATLHLSRPWAPPARSGAPLSPTTPRWIAAAVLTDDLGDITTRFQVVNGAVPRTVVVRLDRRNPKARTNQVQVTCGNGTIGDPEIVQNGEHVDLVYTVRADRAVRGTERAISIGVSTGANWRLTGVVAPPQTTRQCVRLLADPHVRLQQIPKPAAGRQPASVVVQPKPVRIKR